MRIHISAGRYQLGAGELGAGEPTESGKKPVPTSTIGVIATALIALVAVLNAYGNLTRAISEGDQRVRQAVVESERVLRDEIGGVREEIREDIQGVREEIQWVREEIGGIREEINSNYRELRDLVGGSDRR